MYNITTSLQIWSRLDGSLKHTFRHPHAKEISGVKIIRNRIYVSCLFGSLAVLSADGFQLIQLIANLGEIYSMAGDENHLLTGHTSANTSIQVYISTSITKRRLSRQNFPR